MTLLDESTQDFQDQTYNLTGGILDSLPPVPQAPQDPNDTTIHSYEQEGQPATPQPQGGAPVQMAQQQGQVKNNGKVQWVPGVGFVQPHQVQIDNKGNTAMEWQAAAGSPAPPLAAIQAHNAQMTNPANGLHRGGPGSQTPSTQRFYNRKLARAILMNKGSGPEARAQAHNDLRFQGAPPVASSMGAPDAWDRFFQDTIINDFGAGREGHQHQNDKLKKLPDGSLGFWTNIGTVA